MKIAILGATGATGRLFTALALKNGHEVTALVRNAAKLSATDKLRVIVGDATNEHAVKQVVDGADVVVSTLGHVAGEAPMMTIAVANILSAARKQAAPPRCVIMTTMGVGGTSYHVKLILSLFVAGIKVIADYETADAAVRNGDAPYVLVRAGHLIDGPSTDAYTTSLNGCYHIAMQISRADVASFLLRAASSEEFENKAVQIYT